MKLPSVVECPRCSSRSGQLFRQENRSTRSDSKDHRSDRPVTRDQARVSVFDRLGSIKQDDDEQCFDCEVDEEFQKGTGSM
jgi:hypothetical protein